MADPRSWPGGTAPLLLTCVGVESDLDLLPHFLDHYRRLGIPPDRVRPILNAARPDAPELARARRILAEAGAAPAEIWIAPYTSDTMWARRRALQSREAGAEDWVLSADVDEFHEYPEPLADFLIRCAQLRVDCVQGVFIDRLAPGGRLPPVRAAPAILEQFPVAADVGWSIAGAGAAHDRFGTVKLMAMRGRILPSRGGHHPMKDVAARFLYGQPLGRFAALERPSFRFAVPTRVHHVHWTESLPARLEKRLATPGVSPAGAEYGRRQLDHIERHGGIALARVAVAPEPAVAPGGWTARLARLRARGRWQALRATARRRVAQAVGR